MPTAPAATQRTRVFISRASRDAAALEPHLRALARTAQVRGGGAAFPCVVALASEILLSRVALPPWSGEPDTRFLVILDVPEPASMRLPAVLRLHRPDLRLHVTRDPGCVRRLLIAWTRREPWRGIVDGYVLGGDLNLVLGDLTFRSFPFACLPRLRALPEAGRGAFEIDPDGSYLHWSAGDLHFGASQLLQEVDPMHMVDVQIERDSRDRWGAAVAALRAERGLRQKDVPGLSERQVSRIEKGTSRLTEEAARLLAAALGYSLHDFLDELARRASDAAGR